MKRKRYSVEQIVAAVGQHKLVQGVSPATTAPRRRFTRPAFTGLLGESDAQRTPVTRPRGSRRRVH